MTILPSRAMRSAPGAIIVMGVAVVRPLSAGLLAGRLAIPYAEADSFHPGGNITKMSQGLPLTDQDREPWLEAIADRIRHDSRLVVSCSALKRAYRNILRQADPPAWFLHLVIDRDIAIARVAARADHFMPASLVDSQFADLEPLRGEAGLTVDAARPPEELAATALNTLAPTASLRIRPSQPAWPRGSA